MIDELLPQATWAFPLALLATIYLSTFVLHTILRLEANSVDEAFRDALLHSVGDDTDTFQRAAFIVAHPQLTYRAVYTLEGGAVWVTWGFYVLTLRFALACLFKFRDVRRIDAALTITQRLLATIYLLLQSLLLSPHQEPSPSAVWYLERLYAWNLVSWLVFPAGFLELVYAVISLLLLAVLCGRYIRLQHALVERLPCIILKEVAGSAVILALEAWRWRCRRHRRVVDGRAGAEAVGAQAGGRRRCTAPCSVSHKGAAAAALMEGLRDDQQPQLQPSSRPQPETQCHTEQDAGEKQLQLLHPQQPPSQLKPEGGEQAAREGNERERQQQQQHRRSDLDTSYEGSSNHALHQGRENRPREEARGASPSEHSDLDPPAGQAAEEQRPAPAGLHTARVVRVEDGPAAHDDAQLGTSASTRVDAGLQTQIPAAAAATGPDPHTGLGHRPGPAAATDAVAGPSAAITATVAGSQAATALPIRLVPCHLHAVPLRPSVGVLEVQALGPLRAAAAAAVAATAVSTFSAGASTGAVAAPARAAGDVTATEAGRSSLRVSAGHIAALAGAASSQQLPELRSAEHFFRRMMSLAGGPPPPSAGATAAATAAAATETAAPAGRSDGSIGTPPRPPPYVAHTRLSSTRVKIRGLQPEAIPPGHRERIAAVVAAAGHQLEGVYVRRGCIELVIDWRRLVSPPRVGACSLHEDGAFTVSSDDKATEAAKGVHGSADSWPQRGLGGGGGGGGGDGNAALPHGSVSGDGIDLGAVLQALKLPLGVLCGRGDEGARCGPVNGAGGVEACFPGSLDGATSAKYGADPGAASAFSVKPEHTGLATGVGGSSACSSRGATGAEIEGEQDTSAAGIEGALDLATVAAAAAGVAAAALPPGWVLPGSPFAVSVQALGALPPGATPVAADDGGGGSTAGGTGSGAGAGGPSYGAGVCDPWAGTAFRPFACLNRDGGGAARVEEIALSVLVWAPTQQSLELSVRSKDRHLPLTCEAFCWQPLAPPLDQPAALHGAADGPSVCTGFLASAVAIVQELPPAPALLLVGVVDESRAAELPPSPGADGDTHDGVGDGEASGTATDSGSSPVSGLAPLLLLDESGLEQELALGLHACFGGARTAVPAVSIADETNGSGSAHVVVEVRDLLSDLGCFLQQASAASRGPAASQGPATARAAAGADAAAACGGVGGSWGDAGAGGGAGAGGDTGESRQRQLIDLGLHLLDWFNAAGGVGRWPLLLSRLQRELVALCDAEAAEVQTEVEAEAKVWMETQAEVEMAAAEVMEGKTESEVEAEAVGCRPPAAKAIVGGGSFHGGEAAGAVANAHLAPPSSSCRAGARRRPSFLPGYSCYGPPARGLVARLVGCVRRVGAFQAQLEEPGYQAYLRDYIQSQMQATDLFVFTSISGLMLRSWQQEPEWRQRPALAFLVHFASMLVTVVPHIAQLATYVVVPREQWGCMGQALQAARMAGYILSNVLVGYLGFDMAQGVRTYQATKAVWIGDALALGASILVMPQTAAIMSALRIPTHIAMWRAIGVPFGTRHMVLRAVGLALLTAASNLAFHTALRMSFSRRSRRLEEAAHTAMTTTAVQTAWAAADAVDAGGVGVTASTSAASSAASWTLSARKQAKRA